MKITYIQVICPNIEITTPEPSIPDDTMDSADRSTTDADTSDSGTSDSSSTSDGHGVGSICQLACPIKLIAICFVLWLNCLF